jgi:hypothetical protein
LGKADADVACKKSVAVPLREGKDDEIVLRKHDVPKRKGLTRGDA